MTLTASQVVDKMCKQRFSPLSLIIVAVVHNSCLVYGQPSDKALNKERGHWKTLKFFLVAFDGRGLHVSFNTVVFLSTSFDHEYSYVPVQSNNKFLLNRHGGIVGNKAI